MSSSYYGGIVDPGNALEQNINASLNLALSSLLKEIADDHGCCCIMARVGKTKAGRQAKRLILADNCGNEYDIGGVITDICMRPLILVESKYIRYKKHNRDKGSWVCTAHSAIRRRYHSIRSSITVLAGNWSQSSVAIMESHDITIFFIPFDFICDCLDKLGIDFRWGEKEQEKAFVAWEKFNQLTLEEQASIGEDMIALIKDALAKRVGQLLDDTIDREIKRIVVELVSNLGEVKIFEFGNIEDALTFLEQADLVNYFVTKDSVTLFDPPPNYD